MQSLVSLLSVRLHDSQTDLQHVWLSLPCRLVDVVHQVGQLRRLDAAVALFMQLAIPIDALLLLGCIDHFAKFMVSRDGANSDRETGKVESLNYRRSFKPTR